MIEHDRFYMKHMRTEDIPSVCELLKSCSAKMLSDNFGRDMDESRESNSFVSTLNDCSHKSMVFLVYLKKSGKLIGYATISKINWISSSAEISIMINDKYQFIGYGTAVYLRLSAYCFEELNLIKVYSKIRSDNTMLPDREKGQFVRKIPLGNGEWRNYYYTELTKYDKYII